MGDNGVPPLQYSKQYTAQPSRATTMSDPTETNRNVLRPGHENVHPLFHATRFPQDIDYDAFYEPALLATRLIYSPSRLTLRLLLLFWQDRTCCNALGLLNRAGSQLLAISVRL